METPEQTVLRAYGHFARGEVTELLAALAPDVEWRVAGQGGNHGGAARGRDGVEAVLTRWMTTFAEVGVRPLEFHAAGDTVFVVGEVTAVLRDGETIRSPAVQLFEVKDGLVTRFESFSELGARLPVPSVD